MTDPITQEDLVAYAAGDLAGPDADRVKAWIEQDPAARATVARFLEVRDHLAADAADTPPAELMARARAIFAVNTATPWKRWLEVVDTVVASLIFDSRLQTVAVRDDAGGDRFQLAFESDAADVDVQVHRLEPGPGGSSRWRVMGQVAADGADGAVAARRVALRPAGSVECRVQTVTDDRGIFEFDADAGLYDLAIDLHDQEVLLPRIRMD